MPLALEGTGLLASYVLLCTFLRGSLKSLKFLKTAFYWSLVIHILRPASHEEKGVGATGVTGRCEVRVLGSADPLGSKVLGISGCQVYSVLSLQKRDCRSGSMALGVSR